MTNRVMGMGHGKAAAIFTFALGIGFASAVLAGESETEKQALQKCEIDICRMITDKSRDGADLTCQLSKTWQQEDIEKGAQEKKLTWGFGRARCNVAVDVKRADIVDAVTKPEYTLKIEKQPVDCEIERNEEKYPIKLTLAPVLQFKDGKATEAQLGVDNIEGTTLIKGVVWTAATLEQNFGLFQSDIVREVNKFIERQCPKRLASGG